MVPLQRECTGCGRSRVPGVALSDGSLCFYGRADGVDDTRELRQHTVAHELDDAAVMFSDLGFDEVRA